MKKAFLFIGLVISGLSVSSQDLHFTKGDVTPGQIKNGKTYEDFMGGNVKVTDDQGKVYTFVRANLEVVTKDGKKLQYMLSRPGFTEAQSYAIIKADDEGTVYVFTGVTVKDSNGQERVISGQLKYEFPNLIRG